MYVKPTNGQSAVYSVEQLRRDNPNTSFPAVPSDALLAEWGVYPYYVKDRPAVDYMTQTVTPTALAQVDGAWTQGWEVSNLSVEDAGRNIRSQRAGLLSQTDWMALSDVNMASEWAAYRQALRDITEQAGFPFAVIWPLKPTE